MLYFWGETKVREDHILLPESYSIFNHYCQLDTATYIWGELKPTLYQWIKSFQGHIIYQEGQEVLISQTDKIRLVLGEEEKNMGRVYQQTKYSDILVINGTADYLDKFPASHLKLGAWVASRDDYLAYALEQEMLKALRKICISIAPFVYLLFAFIKQNYFNA